MTLLGGYRPDDKQLLLLSLFLPLLLLSHHEKIADIHTSIPERPFRLPFQLLLTPPRHRHTRADIALSPLDSLPLNRFLRYTLHGLDHIGDGIPIPSPEIERPEILPQLLLRGCRQGGDVAHRQIGDVDKIPHGGSVRCIPVGTEHGELVVLARHDFDNDREEVGGDALWVFAEEPGLIAADRVEVAQGDDGPFWVGEGEVGEDGFAHPFGAAVGVRYSRAALLDEGGGAGEEFGAVDAVFLSEGNAAVGDGAVDGGGRGEDEVLDAIFAQSGGEVD